ncbi:MAG: hypothetical protein HOP17_09895 [Acidobacteria bacterium]|nr:hypothetical protein [Acidobacteriota bacterium]
MFAAGFEIVEGVFTTDECEEIIAVLDHKISLLESRAGARNLMRDPLISKIAADERLLSITERAFDRPLVPFKATLFQKTGKANWLVAWHQDTALPVERIPSGDGWGPSSVKNRINFVHAPTEALSKVLALRIHLDASTHTNGPLRVIPGSHKKRLIDDGEFGEWTRREAVTCCVGKEA